MERRRVVLADVFAAEPLTGTRVGVVPEAGGLGSSQRAAIADELAGAATAFVDASEDEPRSLDVRGPDGAVDHSGAAAIAAVWSLFESGAIDAGSHELETTAGRRAVEVEDDGVVRLAFDPPSVRSVPAAESRLAEAVGVDPGAIVLEELPVAVASAERSVLVVPIDYLSTVGAAAPTEALLSDLLSTHGATSVLLFTFDTLDRDATLHARQFRPSSGGEEVAIDADAAGALGAYLEHAEAFDDVPAELAFEHGHYRDRPGRTLVSVGRDVRVGGQVVSSLEGEIAVSDREEDEIIEA